MKLVPEYLTDSKQFQCEVFKLHSTVDEVDVAKCAYTKFIYQLEVPKLLRNVQIRGIT